MFLDLLVVCCLYDNCLSHIAFLSTSKGYLGLMYMAIKCAVFYCYLKKKKKAAMILFKKGWCNLINREIMQHFCCLNKVVEHCNHRC